MTLLNQKKKKKNEVIDFVLTSLCVQQGESKLIDHGAISNPGDE